MRSLVERDLKMGSSFDEVLQPIREGFRKRGVTEQELDDVVARSQADLLSLMTGHAAICKQFR